MAITKKELHRQQYECRKKQHEQLKKEFGGGTVLNFMISKEVDDLLNTYRDLNGFKSKRDALMDFILKNKNSITQLTTQEGVSK